MFALIQNSTRLPIKWLWSHLLLQVAEIRIDEVKYFMLYNDTKMKPMRCVRCEKYPFENVRKRKKEDQKLWYATPQSIYAIDIINRSINSEFAE